MPQNAQDSLGQIILLQSKQIRLLKMYKDSLLKTNSIIKYDGKVTLSNDNHNDLIQMIYPSIIAIIIAFIGFWGTLRANKKQRLSSENLINKQLNDSKNAITQQINSAKSIAELDFRKNVLSVNRQNWINELREVMSQVIGQVEVLSIRGEVTKEELIQIRTKILKAQYMLNPVKDQSFIDALTEFIACFSFIAAGKQTMDDLKPISNRVDLFTKTTLKNEWERVKRGE
ncbi:MAG: hypothetical protein ACO1N0_00085 [Fluviicola sp.]